METRESDQVGEVGEEDIRALILSRSEPKFFVSCIFAGLYGLICGTIQGSLKKQYGWSSVDASLIVNSIGFCVLLALVRIPEHSWRSADRPALHLERGSSQIIESNQRFEIWVNPSPAMRWYRVAITAALMVFFIYLAAGSPSRFAMVINALLVGVCAIWVFICSKQCFSPLLWTDSKSVNFPSRSLEWSLIHSIDAEHVSIWLEGFTSIRLTFRDRRGRKLHRVRLPKSSLSITQERAFLEFMARILGREVKPVAQSTPDWI